MAPILFNAAASLASNVVDNIAERFSHHHRVAKAKAVDPAEFDAAMAKVQPAATAPAVPALDQQAALTSQLLASPEVATVLGAADPSKSVQLEMSATGNVSLRGANGSLQALKLSDGTHALATQLYSLRQPGFAIGQARPDAVLAVDPARPSAAVWSALPMRS